jgi:hypothetical protein
MECEGPACGSGMGGMRGAEARDRTWGKSSSRVLFVLWPTYLPPVFRDFRVPSADQPAVFTALLVSPWDNADNTSKVLRYSSMNSVTGRTIWRARRATHVRVQPAETLELKRFALTGSGAVAPTIRSIRFF